MSIWMIGWIGLIKITFFKSKLSVGHKTKLKKFVFTIQIRYQSSAEYQSLISSVFNLEIGHRGSCWPRQHLTGGQIWKLGVNVKRQRTPNDVNTSCVIGL
jgi:hypothetical protein